MGYITASNTCNIGKIGTIVLHENTINLKGVKVKAMRQNIKLGKEGMLVDIEHSELNKIGTATDVLREMPRVDVSSDGTVNVFAKGSPLIYINNRQVNDLKELHQLKSDNIKNVEIVTAPGAKYNAEIKSVIRIRTISPSRRRMEWRELYYYKVQQVVGWFAIPIVNISHRKSRSVWRTLGNNDTRR